MEALVLIPKDEDSHTILVFTIRPNLTTARDRREFTTFPAKIARKQERQQRQEADRQKSKAEGSSKGQTHVRPPSEL